MKGVKQEEKLMRLISYGKLILYMELVLPTHNPSAGQMQTTSFAGMQKTMVLLKDDTARLVPKRKFVDFIGPYLKDAPEVYKKVRSKKYQYDDLEDIVNEYNSRL